MQADISRWVQRPQKQQRQQLPETTSDAPQGRGRSPSDLAASGGLLGLLSARAGKEAPKADRNGAKDGAPDPAKAALLRLVTVGSGYAVAPGRNPSPPAPQPGAGRVPTQISGPLRPLNSHAGAPACRPWHSSTSGPPLPVNANASGASRKASRGFDDGDPEEGALVVLGDHSKRAAAKRAGLDGERLQQIRAQRARRNEGLLERYNHWDDGGGTWDADTIGLEGADDIGMGWEGRGTKAIGPRM
ncbi:hypothetical protein HYH03_000649 [Edaphochlamys debaryana]|uniref:Uncharacterized protein n=1 Tax=Edaphochlamys debaryana TaxID=47281 RepID=A0A835YHV6_9CHLO|nr:hypothetical protein HYH03_000649 [Edaphochlamys debaryana]|eukprot:KAG2502162.1 hypothetical protein HYH03_000649 [Edaphochlamys debaryana]